MMHASNGESTSSSFRRRYGTVTVPLWEQAVLTSVEKEARDLETI